MVKKLVLVYMLIGLAVLNLYQWSVIQDFQKPSLSRPHVLPLKPPVAAVPQSPPPSPPVAFNTFLPPGVKQRPVTVEKRYVNPSWLKIHECEEYYAKTHPEVEADEITSWCTNPRRF